MDILIFTELDNRETDAACLIKCEMERRGYSVAVERYNRVCETGTVAKYKPKIMILPWLYNEVFLQNFCDSSKDGKPIIVNLQSEQILSKAFLENSDHHMPSGICKEYLHLAWGNVTYERFIEAGIHENKIWKIGNLNLDLNAPQFRDIYLSRDELSSEYGLNPKKKWCLFISSFSYASMDASRRERYLREFPFTREFMEVSIKSRDILAQWFERISEQHQDIEFIYRPHPSESSDPIINKLSNMRENFHVISELSVRQWIMVSNINLTWFSTSIADVFYQHKGCGIVRPIPIPVKNDCELFYNSHCIDNYDTFEAYILSEQTDEFPIPAEEMEKYYGQNEIGTNYLEFCDRLETAMKEGEFPAFDFSLPIRTRMNRALVSTIFRINNYVYLGKILNKTGDDIFSKQLNEKHQTWKAYKRNRDRLCKKLRSILGE